MHLALKSFKDSVCIVRAVVKLMYPFPNVKKKVNLLIFRTKKFTMHTVKLSNKSFPIIFRPKINTAM